MILPALTEQLHVTLAKSAPNARFDASDAYSRTLDLGEAVLNEVVLCRLGSWNSDRKSYAIEGGIRFA